MAKNGYEIGDELIEKFFTMLWELTKKGFKLLTEKEIDVKKELWRKIFESYKISDNFNNQPLLTNITCNVGDFKKKKKSIDLVNEKYTFITKTTFSNIIKHKDSLQCYFNRELDITQKSFNSFEICKVDKLAKKSNEIEKILNSIGIIAKLIQKQETKLSTIYKLHVDNFTKFESMKKEIAFKLKKNEKELVIMAKDGIAILKIKKKSVLIKYNDLYDENENKISKMELPVVYGLDDNDDVIIEDMAKTLNMIVAGSTGFGKSVFLHSLIITLLRSMSQVLLYLFDPKGSELYDYANHKSVVHTDNKNNMLSYLKGVDRIMRQRNSDLKGKARNIQQWNATQPDKWPWIVVIIDEMADIVMSDKADDEEKERAESIKTYITKLAQMGRSVGIRLVLCTQKPNKEIIDTIIKANCITRVCFKVSNSMESRIVIDDVMASEQLKRPGEAIALLNSEYTRIKSAFMDDAEIEKMIKEIL